MVSQNSPSPLFHTSEKARPHKSSFLDSFNVLSKYQRQFIEDLVALISKLPRNFLRLNISVALIFELFVLCVCSGSSTQIETPRPCCKLLIFYPSVFYNHLVSINLYCTALLQFLCFSSIALRIALLWASIPSKLRPFYWLFHADRFSIHGHHAFNSSPVRLSSSVARSQSTHWHSWQDTRSMRPNPCDKLKWSHVAHPSGYHRRFKR